MTSKNLFRSFVLLAALTATQAFGTQVSFTFTSNQIVSAFSTNAYSSATKNGWLGTYSYGSSANGRPQNYLGAAGAWQGSPFVTAAITDFYMRPDSLDALAVATYSVIDQTSSSSPTFSTRGTEQLPNYLSGTFQNSNSSLTSYIANAADNSRLFAEYGDSNTADVDRYGIFSSNVSSGALPSTYHNVTNATYSVTLDGNYIAGNTYKFVFYLWGDQLDNGFNPGGNWIAPLGSSKDTFLGAVSMDLTAQTPEPGTFGVLGAGLLAAVAAARRRRSSKA